MDIALPPERLAAGRASFQRLADEAGLPYAQRTRWYDSLPAHEAAEWAHDRYSPEQEEEFRRAIFAAYFAHGRNIGDPAVLEALASTIGLDGADLRRALVEHQYRERVQAQFVEARETGVDGVPTIVAGQYAVVGAQPYAIFERLMEVIGEPKKP